MKNIYPVKLEIGKHYVLYFSLGNGAKYKMLCKFIQVTKCGFNFLNLDTNKCVLKHHLYKIKKNTNYFSKNWFYISKTITIN